ncbi:MAG TPA: hypothetical protein VFQ21_03930 [Gemmatimonadota bacterium]|nr:hypothetical protein [Gemmatimonadota bacterium]
MTKAFRIDLGAALAILTFGAVLRTIQYAAQGSMWLDELAIAVNVAGRDLGGLLFRPLDEGQVAPPGFLALEKLGGVLLGHDEYGLRLFPWLWSLAALPLFWRVSSRFVSGPEIAAGLLAFAASPALVWYAGNAKQYSGDVAVTLLLLFFSLRLAEGRMGQREAALAGVGGGLAILAAQPAVLVAFGLCVVLGWGRLRARESLGPVLALGAGWAAGAALVTAAGILIVAPATLAQMQRAWTNDFFPLFPPELRTLSWLPLHLYWILGHLLLYIVPKSLPEVGFVLLFCALSLIGGWSLVRRRSAAGAILAVPLVVAVLASAVHVLPVSKRVSLFVAPTLLVMAMAGASEIRALLPARARTGAALALLALFAMPAGAVVLLAPPPYRAEESRPVLDELARRWRPGDAVYVYGSASLAMRFYGPPVEWIEGSIDRADSRTYFREIDRIRGRPRVWLFITHSFPCEPEAIRSYLEAIGTELNRIEDPFGLVGQRAATAYLYDLSDPDRLALADAETHPYVSATRLSRVSVEGCGYGREPGQLPF